MDSMSKDDLVRAVRALGWDVDELPGKLYGTPKQIHEWLRGVVPVPSSVATLVRRALRDRPARDHQRRTGPVSTWTKLSSG
jgi:hypothetical protein